MQDSARAESVPERIGRLAQLTPFYSITVPVVQFFLLSMITMFARTTMAYLFTSHLTLGFIRFGSNQTHGSPVQTQASDSPNLSIMKERKCSFQGWQAKNGRPHKTRNELQIEVAGRSTD